MRNLLEDITEPSRNPTTPILPWHFKSKEVNIKALFTDLDKMYANKGTFKPALTR